MSLESLKHVKKDLPGGGMVLVLDTGAQITPEAEAMIQALHSRSAEGVNQHLKTLAEKGAEKFMSSFYVGYGHKSIGDCGSVTLFIEGVSMLAAKAIQDWRLYSGQESSTRYIDFSNQTFIDPVDTKESKEVLENWRQFYLANMEPMRQHLKQLFPRQAEEKETIYEKAINARAFDNLRGFLPAGASTNLAWHTNLRQAADKIMLLRHHPLVEVKNIGLAMEEALQEAYPSSFMHKHYEQTEQYNEFWVKKHSYFTDRSYNGVEVLKNDIDKKFLEANREVLEKRPAKTELPKYLAEAGTLQFGFMLDFGSFRDIQRHRAVVQPMPLLTIQHGFHPFYLNSLPNEQIKQQAIELIAKQEKAIAELNISPEDAQYYTAMGYNLPIRVTGDLSALVYLVELRATRFVHPTLQVQAVKMAEILKQTFSDQGLVLHLDADPGRFDVKRGEHDITVK